MRGLMRRNLLVPAYCVALLCLLSFWVFFSACDPETVEALKEEPIDEELIEVKEQPAVDVEVRDPRIPSLAYRLKRMIRGEINYHWGLGQDGTVFYAQIHQESGWNPKAKSAYASGLAQFTPDTADWISRLYPADLGDNNPLDVRWAIRAVIRYDKWLYDRFNFAFDNSNRWRFSLSGYNGGAGWVSRDRELTKARGKDPRKWICNVEHFSKRALWAFKENRDYVTKILDKWVPLYMKGGFV